MVLQTREQRNQYVKQYAEFTKLYPYFMRDVEAAVTDAIGEGKCYARLDLFGIDRKYLSFLSTYIRKNGSKRFLTRTFDGVKDGDQMAVELFWQ